MERMKFSAIKFTLFKVIFSISCIFNGLALLRIKCIEFEFHSWCEYDTLNKIFCETETEAFFLFADSRLQSRALEKIILFKKFSKKSRQKINQKEGNEFFASIFKARKILGMGSIFRYIFY